MRSAPTLYTHANPNPNQEPETLILLLSSYPNPDPSPDANLTLTLSLILTPPQSYPHLDSNPDRVTLTPGYELLGLFPHAHIARLAAFLGTTPTDEHMLSWLGSIRPPNPNTASSVRASWQATAQATASPSTPTATPYRCNDEHNTVVARKLQAEVALWHKDSSAWRETRPWYDPFPYPFPWPQDDGSRVLKPPWMRACNGEWAGGTALTAPADLGARCLDAFRAALRQWFYGATDDLAIEAFPRAPLSREPCTGASVEHNMTSEADGVRLFSSPSPYSFVVYERGVPTVYRHVRTALLPCNLVYIKVFKCASSTTGECVPRLTPPCALSCPLNCTRFISQVESFVALAHTTTSPEFMIENGSVCRAPLTLY